MKMEKRPSKAPARKEDDLVLITGGAGFIGTNLTNRLAAAGQRVRVFDNLSRRGVTRNLEWLKKVHGDRVEFVKGDTRNAGQVRAAVKGVRHIFHFAAQVAVTTSLDDPIHDFEVNCGGTINLLEALRNSPQQPSLIYTSTNKVYGDLGGVNCEVADDRYEPRDEALQSHGFGENHCLAFHSPYGCSKGAAEQYVLDYARTFDLRTLVFRMSCIYGPHQFGNEDQGWVAHFLIQALQENDVTIYGDGRQVRDILFVEDLVNAFLLAEKNIGKLRGEAFNIGGGPRNTISLLELVSLIRDQGFNLNVKFEDWRAADQRYYVSDIRKFQAATGWQPIVGVKEGVKRLRHWLQEFYRPLEEPVAK
jgi:CDP-paratose 2-epimerase